MNDDDAFFHWLAGFIDGEGCFLVKRNGKGGGRVNALCAFELTVRADDEPILHEIVRRTGVGRVQAKPTFGRGNRAPHTRWTVWRKRDAIELMQCLERYPLRAKKSRDFAIWREAVLAWARCDTTEVLRLGRELSNRRRFAASDEPLETSAPPTLFASDRVERAA